MENEDLQTVLSDLAVKYNVPGVAAGVLVGGEEHLAYAGVTSMDNPLPVDATTYFQFGSTGKTFTATAIMVLVDQGKVRLDDPVRVHVPELRLRDEDVASRVTILQLLNHTAGWDGDVFDDTGDGDDALEKYVALLAGIDQVTPLGATISYNNAALNLAGRVIEKVTGLPYERAIAELVLNPLGLHETCYRPADVMTRRFAVGHELSPGEGATPQVVRPLFMPRSSAPAGSTATATARDQLAWARFHLGDGSAPDGTRLLSEESLKSMQQPSVQIPAGALGDAIGISWMLRVAGGVIAVAHGGTTHGQHSSFLMVPERDFAVISMSNCGPNGPQLNDELTKWALDRFLGISEAPPELAELTDDELAAYAGSYDTVAVTVHIAPEGGRLVARVELKPAAIAMLTEAGQDPAEQEQPFALAMITGQPDQYVVPDGPGGGMRGYFTRSESGEVDGIHLGGRLATRLVAVPS